MVICLYVLLLLTVNLNYIYGQLYYDHDYDGHGYHPHQPHHPPLVTVNKGDGIYHDDKKHVGVHVPHIYNMDLLKSPHEGLGLGINVLKGLVRVNLHRNRNPFTGHKSGPISVEVGGVPVYNKLH